MLKNIFFSLLSSDNHDLIKFFISNSSLRRVSCAEFFRSFQWRCLQSNYLRKAFLNLLDKFTQDLFLHSLSIKSRRYFMQLHSFSKKCGLVEDKSKSYLKIQIVRVSRYFLYLLVLKYYRIFFTVQFFPQFSF